MKALSCAWKALPVDEKRAYVASAALAFARKEVAWGEPGGPKLSGDGFWGKSTVYTPCGAEHFCSVISARFGQVPGATRYLPVYRSDMCQGAFVQDDESVVPGTKYAQRVSCWERHPGLCREALGVRLPVLLKAGGELERHTRVNTFYCLVSEGEKEEEITMWALCVKRSGKQKAFVLCAEMDDGTLTIGSAAQDRRAGGGQENK